MVLFKSKSLDLYIIPCFIFLIISSGDTATMLRPVVTYVLPTILFVQYFISKRYIKLTLRLGAYSKLRLSISIYILWLFISTLMSPYPLNSLYYLLKTIIFFFIVHTIYKWLDSSSKYFLLLKAVKYSAFFVATIVLIQAFLNAVGLISVDSVRLGGVYGNVNTGGFVLSMLALFCYYAYIVTKQKSNIYLFVYCLMAVFLTGSRAALMLVFVAFVFMYFRRSIPRAILVVFVLGMCITLIGVYIYMDKIWDFLRIDNGTAGRNFLWIIAMQIIIDYFYCGIGIGNLKTVATPYLEAFPDISNWEKEGLLENAIQSSHNMYIEAFVETGVIGFLLYLFVLINVIRQIRRKKLLTTYVDRQLSYLLWGVIVGIMFRGFFESNGFMCKGWLNADILFWLLFVLYKRKDCLTCQY